MCGQNFDFRSMFHIRWLWKVAPLALFIFVSTPGLTEAQSQVPIRTVFTIAYLDVTPAFDVDQLQQQFIDDLRLASRWHGYQSPNNPAALRYQTYGGSIIKLNEVPPHRADNDQFDYAAVYQRFNLCALIQSHQVDEVWVWESGSGHAEEWVTNGPVWSWTKGTNVPNCGRTISSLNLNYELEVDYALHSFGHRIEGALMTNRPCDFYTETYPWTGWPLYCTGKVSDVLGYVARPFAGNNNIGMCGDIHHPPNILDNREYIYDDMTVVQSHCKDAQWNGTATVSQFNCSEWGCSQGGYMIWWMQNLPGIGNNSHDRQGKVMPSWWDYLFDRPSTQAPVGNGSGLLGQYFDDETLSHVVFTRTDPTINYFWEDSSPDPRLPTDGFSVRWIGQIEPAYSEPFVFYAYSDDGVRLWINNQLIINDWIIRGGTESAAVINLVGGQRYDIKVEYFDDGGLAQIRLAWESERQPRQVVPKDRLYLPDMTAAPKRNYFTSNGVTLTWNPVSWAAGYELRVSKNTMFTPMVYDHNALPANTLSMTLPTLDNGVYYWQVRAKKDDGGWGGWSAVDQFEVAVP